MVLVLVFLYGAIMWIQIEFSNNILDFPTSSAYGWPLFIDFDISSSFLSKIKITRMYLAFALLWIFSFINLFILRPGQHVFIRPNLHAYILWWEKSQRTRKSTRFLRWLPVFLRNDLYFINDIYLLRLNDAVYLNVEGFYKTLQIFFIVWKSSPLLATVEISLIRMCL